MEIKIDLNKILEKRICPGCGTLNPKSVFPYVFCCEKCEWESSDGLPTIGKIMRSRKWNDCSDVNLGAFLKTLLSE